MFQCPKQYCDNTCDFGRKLDLYGCETCECIDPCADVTCGMHEQCVAGLCVFQCKKQYCEFKCDNGYALDDYGCETCECIADPCDSVACSNGQKCENGECGV